MKDFFGIAYPDTLLDLDSGFANTEFAEKYCSVVSAPSHSCNNVFNELTVASRETKLVTDSFCERRVGAAS